MDSQITASSSRGTELDPHVPARWGREQEECILQLCTADKLDPDVWRQYGPTFFMAGIAVMLASSRGMDRAKYMHLAEALYPGSTRVEVFALWLQRSPLRPSRFMPVLRARRAQGIAHEA